MRPRGMRAAYYVLSVSVLWCSGRDLNPGHELSPLGIERLECLTGLHYRSASHQTLIWVTGYIILFLLENNSIAPLAVNKRS
jgi:hypothetical protein